MKNLYANFDALYVAFQGCLPRVNREILAEAKARAGETGEPARVTIGRVTGHVKSTGAQGGYAFVFDQGPLKPKYLFKDNGRHDDWNIFAQATAEGLIAGGWKDVADKMHSDLRSIGVKIAGHSINRVDYAVDFENEDFELDPKLFVAHHMNRAKRHYECAENSRDDVSIIGLSKVSSVTIGTMPNRQVIVYKKSSEVVKKKKFHWFEAWGIKRGDKKTVWRVEVRAGKNHLKEWNIKTFDDLQSKCGDMFAGAFKAIKYVETRDVSNISRAPLHELWLNVIDVVTNKLWAYISGVSRGRIQEVKREAYVDMIDAQAIGLLATGAAAVKTNLVGEDLKKFIMRRANARFSQFLTRQWGDFCDKIDKAKDRLIFLDDLKGRV